jgi:hypothetical protein
MRRLSTQSERSDCVWKVDGWRSDFLGDDTGAVSYARCVKRVAVPEAVLNWVTPRHSISVNVTGRRRI